MRQRLTIILTVIVILGALVVLNTITYVKKEKPLDTELAPNRSTYHSGPTGTRALYDFLSESGLRVIRWRESPDRLLTPGANIRTLVVIGSTQLPFGEEHALKTLTPGRYDLKVTITDAVAGTSASQLADFIVR